MRTGLLPSQQRALQRAFKKADKFDHFRQHTRRSLLAAGCAALCGAFGAYWMGANSATSGNGSAPPSEHPRLIIVRRLAAATDDSLWAQRATFLQAADEVGGSESGWLGMRRLAKMTLATGREDKVFAARLLKSMSHERPAYLEDVHRELQAMVR